jgi:hypothetical protein
MTPERQVFFSPADGGGDGGTDGGDAVATLDGTETHWLDENQDFAEIAGDADARKQVEEYKTPADQLKGHVELKKQFRQSFRVPDSLDGLPDDEVTKITDRLKGILKPDHLRAFSDIPDSPEGYTFEIPEGSMIDEQGITDFKTFAHAKGLDKKTAQDLVTFQLDFVNRLNVDRNKLFEKMANANYKRFVEKDCDDDKDLAAVRMENVMRLLQASCVNEKGQPDPVAWEKFMVRMFYNGKPMEYVLMRALHEAATLKMGTGGAGPGGGGQGEGEINVEERWPKSAQVMKQ